MRRTPVAGKLSNPSAACTDHPAKAAPSTERLITLAETARRIGRQKKTLHNMISDGRLGGQQGLCYVMGRPMVDWEMFEVAFVKRAD